MNVLPDSLSDLLEVGLRDLELCEQDDRYRVDIYMDNWHIPRDGYCYVDLAGCVMAQTLNAPIDQKRTTTPWMSFDNDDWLKLEALWLLSEGYTYDAAKKACQGPDRGEILQKISDDRSLHDGVPDYRDSPAKFKVALRHQMEALRAASI